MLGHGTEGCNYLLAVDVDMNTVDGYAISSWERGYGDMMFDLDLDHAAAHPGAARTRRRSSATCPGSTAAARSRQSPRSVLKPQVDAAAELGYAAFAGTELEFILFEESYEQRLGPALPRADRRQPLQRRLLDPRRQQGRAGAARDPQRDVRRRHERGVGQGRVQLRPARDRLPLRRRRCAPATTTRSTRPAAKEIAARHGQSLTFMAKFDEREGNSCHIHLSLRGTDGEVVFADDDRDGGRSELFDQFMAGLLATMRELTYFYAPNINSYKRFAAGSFAPTAVAWGTDNRTCALRVVGHGSGLRVENRLPGGDVNPYLAVAAMMAGGLHGIREGLELPPVARATPTPATTSTCPAPWPRPRPPRGQRHRPRGLRRRRRRPLRQRGGRRDQGVQRRGHRLGTRPRLREAVTPPP